MNRKIDHKVSVVAFDGDDTLWRELDLFMDYEREFYDLLSPYLPERKASQMLQEMEKKNIPYYGYGLKSVMLSMLETLAEVAGECINQDNIMRIIAYGKGIMDQPMETLDGVIDVLSLLKDKYRLVLATKGDLLDQRRKLEKSGLESFFSHIEVMPDKRVTDYEVLLEKLHCPAEEFVMIGNSVRSDILPVLTLGGYAVHIPYHITWVHEHHDGEVDNPRFFELDTIQEVINIL